MVNKQWVGKTNSGNTVKESETTWDAVKKDLVALSLDNNGQIITLPENLSYVQGKTASGSFNGDIQIHSRYLGFVLGNNTVVVRIDEKTNNIKIEINNVPSGEKPVN